MRKLLGIFFILIAGLALASCNNETKNYNRVINYAGNEYRVADKINKIVVMDLGFLDIIDELDLDVEVAIPDSSLPNYLNEYADAPKIGGLKTPNEEAIVLFEPDVIILGGRQSSYVEEFNKIAPTFLVSQATNENAIEHVYRNLELAIDLFSLDKSVLTSKKETVEAKIEATKSLVTKANDEALILLYNSGFSAYGSGSRFGIIHDVLGVKEADQSIESSTHGQQMSIERLLELNPERIFVIDRTIAVDGAEGSDLFRDSIYNNLSAKVNNKITYLNSIIWYTIGGGYQSLLMQIAEIEIAYTL